VTRIERRAFAKARSWGGISVSIKNLDKAQLKLVLQTSQRFPAQSPDIKLRLKAGKLWRPTGHAISEHVRGAPSKQVLGATDASGKTKFCSLDAMAEALYLLLKTPAGTLALSALKPGVRKEVRAEITPPCEFEVEIKGPPGLTVKFNRIDLANAGVTRMPCVAVLEGRERGGELLLHVQTFFPAVSAERIEALLDRKTAP
jgi:hypothetical protein